MWCLSSADELTSGTTWHSAAQVTNFGMTQTMVGLKSHSIALYRDLAADADYPDGIITMAMAASGSPTPRRRWRATAISPRWPRGMGVAVRGDRRGRNANAVIPLISHREPRGRTLGPAWTAILTRRNSVRRWPAARARRGPKSIATRPVTGLTQHADDSWTVHTERRAISTVKSW